MKRILNWGWYKLQTLREHMDNAGGHKPTHPETPPSTAADKRQQQAQAQMIQNIIEQTNNAARATARSAAVNDVKSL